MQKVKTLNSKNYTYSIGYRITAKTSYEERQEQRERFLIITAQRTVAIVIIILCTMISLYTKEGMTAVVGLLVGLIMLFCKNLFYQEV